MRMAFCRFHRTVVGKTFSYFLEIDILNAKLGDVRVVAAKPMAENNV